MAGRGRVGTEISYSSKIHPTLSTTFYWLTHLTAKNLSLFMNCLEVIVFIPFIQNSEMVTYASALSITSCCCDADCATLIFEYY